MKTPPLVALRWLDAHGTATNSYELHELPHKALEIVTYGLLLRDDEHGVSVACEYCGGGAYRGVTFVPRSLVVEIKQAGAEATREGGRCSARLTYAPGGSWRGSSRWSAWY